MLRLLQSFFSETSDPPTRFHRDVLRSAIEEVVDGTDPRLRAARQYRKKLEPAVDRALEYVTELVNALPPPVKVSDRSFSSDPRLRALFASSQQFREILNVSQELHQYRQQIGRGLPTDLYAFLRADRTEKNVFGISLEGNIIRRDIPQIAINFHNHHVRFPTATEMETRREVKKRSFKFLIENALNHLVSARDKKQQLEQQYRQLLQKKSKLIKNKDIALGPLLDSSTSAAATPEAINRRLRDIEAELSCLRADSATIDHHLTKVVAILQAPEKYLRLEQVSVTLDHMNIKADEALGNANTLTFNELWLGGDRHITTLLIHFPSNELLPEKDFFAEANRILFLGDQPRLTTI